MNQQNENDVVWASGCAPEGWEPKEWHRIYTKILQLPDKELKKLSWRVGIRFPFKDVRRDEYLNTINETDKETLYREYERIIRKRNSLLKKVKKFFFKKLKK